MIMKSIKEVKMSDEYLMTSMNSLVKILREVLSNMEEEQKAILDQNPSIFQQIMNNRESLIHEMQKTRRFIIKEIDQLSSLHPEIPLFDSEKDKLMNLAQLVGEDRVELLSLRDQIIALIDKMENQNVSNHVLLGNKTNDEASNKLNYNHQYRPGKRRLTPKKNPQPKKVQVETLEIPVDQ